MARGPAVLVIDDGELGDIVAMLSELDVEFAHLRGSAIPASVSAPERVVVTTPRRAMLTKDWPRSSPYRIAVVTEDSNTLRAMLRRVGFDLLLRRPIHEVALRLVIARALYAGEEKRREERVTIGVEIAFRSLFRRKTALLADISQRGCRILGDPLTAGSRLTLPIPKELAPNELSLPCKVVRVAEKPDADGRYEMGLAFENLSKEKIAEVRALLKRLTEAAGIEDPRVFGAKLAAKPATTAAVSTSSSTRAAASPNQAAAAKTLAALKATAHAAREAVSAAKPTESAEPGAFALVPPEDRRKHARAAYSAQIPRLDIEAESVLIGRDLSVGGMRVEHNDSLQVGDVLEIAVYASPREEPIVVKALVSHDAGDGFGLTFDGVDRNTAVRLERLVARLPSVEPLQAGEGAGLGSVVSRVLSNFRAET